MIGQVSDGGVAVEDLAVESEVRVCPRCGSRAHESAYCAACGLHLQVEPDCGPPKVFVSYRREDAAAHAFLLHERLMQRFGEANVFLDVAVLQAGMDWRKAIHARANACGVLIALIGPQWLSIMKRSAQRNVVEAVDDVARGELELALTNTADVEVVPVLVDGASMPAAHELPRSLRAVTDRQAQQLRLASYDQDVERLIARLERIASEVRSAQATDGRHGTRSLAAPAPSRPLGPGATHHERVASLMSGAGHVVVVLGSGVNTGCAELPNAAGLAADLARRFAYEPESEHPHLAEVAEYVDVTWGKPDLYLSLKENLTVECQPSKVHRFFANFPAALQALGRPRRHQLILTTNYDTALEHAFEDASEPFDLAVYMASMGRFVHVPWRSGAEPIAEPNRYHAFPIGDDLELARTLIVKIHGAVDGRETHQYEGGENYVITEDNYIDYLSGSSVEEIVPFQILQKLRSSHCLFLGYDIRDWNLRVFLKRVWGSRIRAMSWAVQEDAGEFERVLWRACGAEVVTEPLDAYVDALLTR